MPLKSMTSFARSSGETNGYLWSWEIKSVNNKGLDIRGRFSNMIPEIEPLAKKALSKAIARGSVQCFLDIQKANSNESVEIDRAVLDQYLSLAAELENKVGVEKPSLDGLLALKGVIKLSDDSLSDEQKALLQKDIMDGLDVAIDQFIKGRVAEGESMELVMRKQIDDLERLTNAARAMESSLPQNIQKRLKERLQDLLEDQSIDADRLEQEVAFLASKADIREELDRLDSHIKSARDLMSEKAPVGRRLDFLTQEFNRETNTLCSKSSETDLTKIGLEMKALIEQFREQVQNIE